MEYVVQGSFETILLVDGLAINLITGEMVDADALVQHTPVEGEKVHKDTD